MLSLHKVVVPRLSGVHRFACLALYRGLLRQCAKLPTTNPELNTSRSLIKQRFRRYKSLQSPSQIVNALKAGYEAFDLLHAASHGDQQGIQRITDLVAEAKSIQERKIAAQKQLAKATPVKPPTKKQLKKEEFERHQQQTALRHPDAEPILSRPRPVVSGKRHIPRLVSARGIPFLRIKKPQPKNLSGVIKSRLEKRWSWVVRRDSLETNLLFCEDEDDWDKLTSRLEDSSWATGVEDSLSTTNHLIRASDLKSRALAEDMWKVVLAERELAAKEREQDKQNEQKQITTDP